MQLYRNSYFSVVKLALLVLLAVAVGSRSQVTMAATMVWAWVAGIAISMAPTAWHLAARGYRLGHPVRLSALRGRGVTTFHHNTLNLSLSLPRLGLPLLVASLLGAHATAAFYEAWMIASFLYILPTHLSTALFAVAVGDVRGLAPRLRAALRVSLLLGGSAAVAIAALAGPGDEIVRPGLRDRQDGAHRDGHRLLPECVQAVLRRRGPGQQQAAEGWRDLRHRRRPGGVPDRGGGWLDGLTGISLGFLAAVTLQAVYYVPQVLRALRPGAQYAGPREPSRARSQDARSSAPSPGRVGGVAASAGPETPGTRCHREKGA